MSFVREFFVKAQRPRYSMLEIVVFAAIIAGLLHWRNDVWRRQLAAATLLSPLPAVRIVEEKTTPDTVAYRQSYDFTEDWFTANIPVWEKALASCKGKPGLRYLEIGSHEGRSAVWMLENILTDPTAQLTAIDIFDGPYKDRYLANIQRTGAADRVTTLTGFSQLVLRELPLGAFDIVYVDGSHAKDDVLEDAVLCWRLVKEEGLLIFDDYQWVGCFVSGTCDRPTDCPKVAIDAFVQCFREHFEVIHNSCQLILKKKKQPDT